MAKVIENIDPVSAENIRKERKRLGKALRRDVPFSCHANWSPSNDRSDPIDLLQAQDQGRVKQLLPIKYGRMLESPFSFFRGSAVLMAADLAGTQDTGIEVNLCGDAHLANFGLFATPERRLVFDIKLAPGELVTVDLSLVGKQVGALVTTSTAELKSLAEALLPEFEAGLARSGFALQTTKVQTGPLDGGLEGRVVDLVLGALVDLRATLAAAMLLFVIHIVLGGGDDAQTLESLDLCHCDCGG